MISLSGLSAAYPGYEAQEDRTAKTQLNQTKAREAAIKLLGANVAGAALAGQQGPQAPPPGQASVPAPKPMPPAVQPPPTAPAGPVSPPPPVASPPAAAVPQAAAPANGKLSLQEATARILARTPGVANHPEILLSALTHFNDLGVLDPEAAAKVEATNKQHTLERVAAAKGHLQALQGDQQPAAPAAAPPPPTATNPQTGAKVQWDGKAWQPVS